MDTVDVLDKKFELYIPYNEIVERVKVIADKIAEDLADRNPLFVIMLNGAFMFAAELMKEVNFPAELSFVKLSSYAGMESSGTVRELIGLSDKVEGRDVVIIEDIVESGLTMKTMIEMLERQKVGSVRIAALFVKPHCLLHDVKVDYAAIEIDDDFIVGFGLDYNGYGRNLKDIYKLK